MTRRRIEGIQGLEFWERAGRVFCGERLARG